MNENDNYESRMSDFDIISTLQQRIAKKQIQTFSPQSSSSKTTIDPYQMMVNRKKELAGEITKPVQNWPDADVKKLEDFCNKMGILGIGCGNMNPIAVLAMLKQKLGIVDTVSQSEGYSPNHPYSETIKNRILLHG
jgi:hypothetical protein